VSAITVPSEQRRDVYVEARRARAHMGRHQLGFGDLVYPREIALAHLRLAGPQLENFGRRQR
jgi:hypothetical protein